MKSLKRVVYTVLFGNYDTLTNPRVKAKGVDYICLVDSDDVPVPSGWEKMVVDNPHSTAVRGQRAYKIWPYEVLPGYIQYLYVDASYNIIRDVTPLFNDCSGFMIKPHPKRSCVYDEAVAVIDLKKDTEDVVAAQMARYEENQMPYLFGCWESGILLRDKSPEALDISRRWLSELMDGSHRDQLSLPYVLWVSGHKVKELNRAKLALFFINKPHKAALKPSPKRTRIWYLQPYAADLNIGREYNEQIEQLPEDDWIAISDQDSCFLHAHSGRQIQFIVDGPGKDYDLLGCLTNRLGSGTQCYGNQRSDDPNVLNHYAISEKLHSDDFGGIRPHDGGLAGMFLLFPKKTWERVKFEENSIYFDSQFSKAVQKWGNVGIMEGVYRFHYYRFHQPDPQSYKEHLKVSV